MVGGRTNREKRRGQDREKKRGGPISHHHPVDACGKNYW